MGKLLNTVLAVVFSLLILGGFTSASAFQDIAADTLPSSSGAISVTRAIHLDVNRHFVSDIQETVKNLDGFWSETIQDSHYVRATFAQKLDSNNDITIYPRIISGNPKIQVYEKDGIKIIEEFTLIKSNQYNKILLTNLQTNQDTFDLRIINGSVEFDHIVDPWPVPTYVGAGTSASGTGTIATQLPTGLQTNDILILFVETSNQAVNISNSNGGTWTEIINSPQGTGSAGTPGSTRLTAFWSRYNGVQGAPVVSDSGDHQLGIIVAFRGVITSGNPWSITSGNVDAISDTSLSASGATTTTANTLVIIGASLDDDNDNFGATWTNADLAGITVRSNVSTTAGNDGRIGIVTGEKATAGTYGATTNTLRSASTKAMMTVALNPPPSVSPTLSISQPDGAADTVTVGDSYSITYTLSDPDDMVTAAFYYDTNNSGLDGTAISGACATAPEGTNVICAWNTMGMAPGTYYVYGIANDGVNSAVNVYSPGQITINASATVPQQVTGLSLSPAPTQIVLSWTAPSDGGSPITGYKIERESPMDDGWSTIVPDTGSTSTTYSDTGLTQNMQYSYRVSAINAIGTGQTSDSATTSTLISATVPDKPTSLNGVIADTQISLSWQAPINDGGSAITDYRIEYSTDAGTVWSVYVDGINTNISVVLTGLDTTQIYLFRVYAINSVGTSLPSDTVTISSQAAAETTVTTSSRNPPKILGVGIFEIIKTDSALNATDQKTRFENYMPYSVYSYYTDEQNYSYLGSFEKVGEFLPTELYSTQAHPIIIDKGKMIQLQVQVQDEYQSSKVEHVAIYFDFEETTTINPGKTYVMLDSPEILSVGDPDKIFQNVKVSKSLENGKLWAIFDITFARPVLTADVALEAWHESKQPVYAKITKIWEKLQTIKLPAKQPTFGLFAQVLIPKIHTSPTCVTLNLCFDPQIVEIQKGGIVQWSNHDTTFIHAITSGSPQTGPDNRFNGLLRPSESFQHIFSTTGTYPYYCMIHPWSTGIIKVYEKGTLIEETPYIPSENIAGSVQLHPIQTSPLVVETISGDKTTKIQPGDTIVLTTRNLNIRISGFVGTHDPEKNTVKITIIRPDGSTSELNALLNDDGNYFIPTTLSNKWLRGNYQIIVQYNKNQIGNMAFYITDDARLQGFAGILRSSSQHTTQKSESVGITTVETWYYITFILIPTFVIVFALLRLKQLHNLQKI